MRHEERTILPEVSVEDALMQHAEEIARAELWQRLAEKDRYIDALEGMLARQDRELEQLRKERAA